MSLFQYGRFKAASGKDLDWKLECDALTDDDWKAIAKIAARHLPTFTSTWAVPTGGEKLAALLDRYHCSDMRYDGRFSPLIVDDVWTTGKSMLQYVANNKFEKWHGFVVFARGPLPPNVKCLFKLELGE